MRDVFFHYPKAAWMMSFICIIFLLQFFCTQSRQKRVQAFASQRLLPNLLVERSQYVHHFKNIAWPAIWILACLALMGPEGNLRYLPIIQPSEVGEQTQEVIFLVDTSGSMSVPDGVHGQTRLEESKEIIIDLLSHLKGVNISLYAFTSDLTPVVPSTLDLFFVQMMVRQLQINEGDIGGTSFTPVLEKLKRKFLSARSNATYTLFLFSDGEDNNLSNTQAIADLVPFSAEQEVKIDTIGMGQLTPSLIPNVQTLDGKPVESKLQPELLKMIAERSQGKYYTASEWSGWALASALGKNFEQKETLASSVKASRQVVENKAKDTITDLYFQIPLGMAIILLLACLYWPEVKSKSQEI